MTRRPSKGLVTTRPRPTLAGSEAKDDEGSVKSKKKKKVLFSASLRGRRDGVVSDRVVGHDAAAWSLCASRGTSPRRHRRGSSATVSIYAGQKKKRKRRVAKRKGPDAVKRLRGRARADDYVAVRERSILQAEAGFDGRAAQAEGGASSSGRRRGGGRHHQTPSTR